MGIHQVAWLVATIFIPHLAPFVEIFVDPDPASMTIGTSSKPDALRQLVVLSLV
jgi:hypothetical protein